LIVALLAIVVAAGTLPGFARSLNVLLICGDDHAPYVSGAYGNQRVRTPNIDRLAAGGVRFDRAYCNSPVCTASRQSFLTGRYPRTIGVTRLTTPLPEAETTLADLLSAAGYATAAFGKMHFNSEAHHGFTDRLDLSDHRRWLVQQRRIPLPEGTSVLPAWKPFKDPARVWLNSMCLPYDLTDAQMPGTWLALQAGEWMIRQGERPFFLVVSFYEPHSPFHFPPEFAGRHAPSSFSVPAVNAYDARQIPACFRDLSAADKQGINAAYYTSVEFLDKNVGLVVDALERSGHADDTLVIYIGDHGYFLGQHGRFEKHACFEEAIRAPLIVRAPQLSPGSSEALVEFVDLAPTILDLCSLPISQDMQGKSLRPLLAGETSQHRPHVFIEYAPNEEAAIRTAQWKLVYLAGLHERDDGYKTGTPPGGREIRLYDLLNDPHELENLADRPQHAGIQRQLLVRLAEHLQATAREPQKIPSGDLFAVLDYCVQSHDISPASVPVK
jgi:choline-sulfatase